MSTALWENTMYMNLMYLIFADEHNHWLQQNLGLLKTTGNIHAVLAGDRWEIRNLQFQADTHIRIGGNVKVTKNHKTIAVYYRDGAEHELFYRVADLPIERSWVWVDQDGKQWHATIPLAAYFNFLVSLTIKESTK